MMGGARPPLHAKGSGSSDGDSPEVAPGCTAVWCGGAKEGLGRVFLRPEQVQGCAGHRFSCSDKISRWTVCGRLQKSQKSLCLTLD